MTIPDLFVDETEYFGFVPYCFTMDLQQSLEEALREVLPCNEATLYIFENLKRNCFVMGNFINRNILKFPQGFKFERIVTDKIVEQCLESRLMILQELEKKKLSLIQELHGLIREYIKVTNINEGFKGLLKYKEEYGDLIEETTGVKEALVEAEDKYNKFIQGTKNGSNDFLKLMEHKDVEAEYYKGELDRLNSISSTETLEFILKTINK